MANVLVEEAHLISIADSLRGIFGETKTIMVPTKVPIEPVKYSSTPNATNFDTYSGGYGNSKTYIDTITITGATKLRVKVQYQTESTNYDYLYIVKGTVTSTPSSGTKYGGSAKTTKTIEFDGDTITFCFKSDGSNDQYLGYFAEITGLDASGNVLSGEITVDLPTEVPRTFRPCDMALPPNSGLYYKGTANCSFGLIFDSTAIGQLQ